MVTAMLRCVRFTSVVIVDMDSGWVTMMVMVYHLVRASIMIALSRCSFDVSD